VNWALAAHGSKATASSYLEEGGATYPPAGAIDGVRDDTGWGKGHGWTSRAGEPLPQWLQVDFGQPRLLTHFVVITYQREASSETAGTWGVMDYQIEMWDDPINDWRSVVTESRGRAVKVRVHRLPEPTRTSKVRIVVRKVAPLDGQARLLQFEAWGVRK